MNTPSTRTLRERTGARTHTCVAHAVIDTLRFSFSAKINARPKFFLFSVLDLFSFWRRQDILLLEVSSLYCAVLSYLVLSVHVLSVISGYPRQRDSACGALVFPSINLRSGSASNNNPGKCNSIQSVWLRPTLISNPHSRNVTISSSAWPTDHQISGHIVLLR